MRFSFKNDSFSSYEKTKTRPKIFISGLLMKRKYMMDTKDLLSSLSGLRLVSSLLVKPSANLYKLSITLFYKKRSPI